MSQESAKQNAFEEISLDKSEDQQFLQLTKAEKHIDGGLEPDRR